MLMHLPTTKFLKSFFHAELERIRTHNVFETKLVCSLKELKEIKPLRLIKNFCKNFKEYLNILLRVKVRRNYARNFIEGNSIHTLSGEKDHLASSIKTFFGRGSDRKSFQEVG